MTSDRWNQLGGAAGIGYVLVAVVAMALPGKPPASSASSAEVKDFVVDKHGLLIAQGWLYAVGAALLLWFALALRRVLHEATSGPHLGDLFFVGTAVVTGVSLVSMAIQIVVAKSADRLSAEAVRVVGVEFGVVMRLLCGFILAATAVAYLACVISGVSLPRWTGWLAIAAARGEPGRATGRGGRRRTVLGRGHRYFWLPGLFTALWYLGASVALLRMKGPKPAFEVERSRTG